PADHAQPRRRAPGELRARLGRPGVEAVTLLLATALGLLATGTFVQLARARGWGKVIRDAGPESHLSKAGTPTMGGAAFLLAAAAAVLVSGPPRETTFAERKS